MTVNFYKNLQAQSGERKELGEVFGALVLKQAQKACFLMPAFLEEGEQAGSFAAIVER